MDSKVPSEPTKAPGAKPPEDSSSKNEWSKVNPKRRPRRKKMNGSPANAGTNDTPAVKTKPFLGRCDELEGFIYNIGTNQADEYIKTTREIVEYVGRTFTAEAKNSIEELTIHQFTQPTMPQIQDPNDVDVMIDKTEQQLSYMDKILIQSQIKE